MGRSDARVPGVFVPLRSGIERTTTFETGHNYAIWGTPESTVNNTLTFGKITSQANSPRLLQLSAIITF
jgi:hypothetical protein